MPKNHRDDFTKKTLQIAYDRVNGKCSFPGCGIQTKGPSFEAADKVSNQGVGAHICAAAPNGPRYDASMTAQERKSIENCIWLCRNHATLIDTDTATFTVEKLKKWKEAAEKRAALYSGEEQNSNPLLNLLPLGKWNEERINIFTFNSGSVELFGREEEMKMLSEFAESDGSFRWFAIAAPGGAGKTRLAYELQKKLEKSGWTCLEIKGKKVWEQLDELDGLYPGNTLFIADYVAPHTKELGEWMKKLSQPEYKRDHPLRLLLLERDTKDSSGNISWFENLILQDRLNINKTGPEKPYLLGPISEDQIPALIRGFAEKAVKDAEEKQIPLAYDSLPEDDEFRIKDKLLSIDQDLVRPLFAMMLTDAWLRDRNASVWNEKELLTDIVNQEIKLLEKRIKDYHDGMDVSLPKSCKLLWMAATIIGAGSSVSLENLFYHFSEDEKVIKEHADDHKSRLRKRGVEPHIVLLQNAGIFEKGKILPMLPDILGEFFVMNGMQELDKDEASDLWSAALEEMPSAVEFFKRLLKDFGLPMMEDDNLRKTVFPEDPGLSEMNAKKYKELLKQLSNEPKVKPFREVVVKTISALEKQQIEEFTDIRMIHSIDSSLPNSVN